MTHLLYICLYCFFGFVAAVIVRVCEKKSDGYDSGVEGAVFVFLCWPFAVIFAAALAIGASVNYVTNLVAGLFERK